MKSTKRGSFNAVRPGLTLIELLMVMGIIAIMLSLLLPAIQMVRTSSMRTSCQNNRRNLEVGIHNFISARNRFPSPPAYDQPSGWGVEILPFVEAQAWYNQFVFNAPMSDPANLAAAGARPDVFECPLVQHRDSAIAGIPAADYVVHVVATTRNRHAKLVRWRLMDASLGTRIPWCFGPEVTDAELATYEHPHPAEGGLGALMDD